MKRKFLYTIFCCLVIIATTDGLLGSYWQTTKAQDTTNDAPFAPDQETVAAAVGTAFTYQGRLTDSANPANGVYDFQFRLFNATTAGTAIGSVLTKEDVSVVDGIFSIQLDFGSNVFIGDGRYLEISVRPGNSTAAFTALSPRRNITPSPYAIYADRTSRLSAPDGSPFDAVTVDNNGNVGVSTTNPAQKLHVAGSYLRVDGRDNEQAYIGGEFGDNVQVGSFNPAIQWVELYNISTQGRMSLSTNQINASSISVSGAINSEQNKPAFLVSVLVDDCGWQRPYLGCPAGYDKAGWWHTGNGGCNGGIEGHGYENGDLDSGWMVMCAAQ